MGKNKPNAYQMFVRDEHRRMQSAGENPIYSSLFTQLDSKWKSLPEEVRQRYKDRANNSECGPRPSPKLKPDFLPTSSTRPSTTNETQFARNNDVKIDFKSNFSRPRENNLASSESKLDIDIKPAIKEEHRPKRQFELVLYDEPGSRQHSHDSQEQASKRHKSGYGIPNWRNIKNSVHPQGDRYFDYHLLKLRTTCESIVDTRGDRIITMPIYTFSCNVLCKHKKKDSKEVFYVPIEFGIYAYSIESGTLGKPYHVLINSGPPPDNYFNDSRDHAMNTHKIKFTQSGNYPPEARSDYRSIYKEMLKYTKGGERTILVADSRDIDQVKLSIEWIYEKASEFDKTLAKPSTWTILPLIEYVASAYNFVYIRMLKNPLPKFTLHYYLKLRLEASLWDYETDMMCDYHKKPENQTKWCALSCAIRAVNCIQAILEEIYENHKEAVKLRTKPSSPAKEGEQGKTTVVAETVSSVATSVSSNIKPPPTSRLSMQQQQQPLYFC